MPHPERQAGTEKVAVMATRRLRVAIIGKISWLRDAVDGEWNLGAWTGGVRRLSCIDASAEPERVVEERLENLGRRNIRYQRVVVSAIGHDLTLRQVVLAAPGSILARLSLFFSSIAVTVLRCFRAGGANLASLSPTTPVSCLDTAEILDKKSRVIANRRSFKTATKSLAFNSSEFIFWLRSEKICVTSPAVLNSSASDSLRLFSERDRRDRPSKVGPNCGGYLVKSRRQRIQRLVEQVCIRVSGVGGQLADRVGQ